jgi:ribosomal peptide maturation radical SAM protein 1
MPQLTAIREASDTIRRFRVALITMPFSFITGPSIQLGLLKALGVRAGFHVDDLYLNLGLGAQLGDELYARVMDNQNGRVTGEWLFSIAAFGEQSSRADYFAAFPEEVGRIAGATGKDAAYLNNLREQVVPAYIEDCFRQTDWASYNVVGFTSAYQQNVASLALARRIKERYPQVTIMFGGSNLAGEMGVEYVRAFPFIDYALNGEGEIVFPELLTRLAEGRGTDDLPGLVTRRSDGSVGFIGPVEPFRDLDSLPVPDYDSFYRAAAHYGIDNDAVFKRTRDRLLQAGVIPVEGSRGCWWGEKSPCTFCGFHRASVGYRRKSPARFISELDELSAKYGKKAFFACDSILDTRYIDGVFGPLAERNAGYDFFYFTKANMSREQLRTLACGGMRLIFPGIESLSTHVLKLMRKGATKLQNVNLLRWSAYYDVHVGWNLLYGFPGEHIEDYVEELETLRLIRHLAPPQGAYQIRLDRFSPNFYDEELFPMQLRQPDASYRYVYPDTVDLTEAAYTFNCLSAPDPSLQEVHRQANDLIIPWAVEWQSDRRPVLTYRRTNSDIVVDDTRSGRSTSFTLVGPDADIYEAFSAAPRTPGQVCATLSTDCAGIVPDEQSVRDACDAFCDSGLMIEDADKYLCLAIPADPEIQ